MSNGRITFLVSEDGAKIEITDPASTITFVVVKLTAQQLCQALSRLSRTPCSFEVRGLGLVGKTMRMDKLEFEMPEHDHKNRDEIAAQEATRVCPEGWTPDRYFGSQESFFNKGGKRYARTTIRKWEDEGNKDQEGEES